MKINTKFNIGDKVYTYKSVFTFSGNTTVEEKIPILTPSKIREISVTISTNRISVDYLLEKDLRSEEDLFTTVDELKKYCNESTDY